MSNSHRVHECCYPSQQNCFVEINRIVWSRCKVVIILCNLSWEFWVWRLFEHHELNKLASRLLFCKKIGYYTRPYSRTQIESTGKWLHKPNSIVLFFIDDCIYVGLISQSIQIKIFPRQWNTYTEAAVVWIRTCSINTVLKLAFFKSTEL